MKVQTKRILSFLLVLVVFCSALLPAMIPRARAVAVVDDAAIAIGLLFAGFAGITFSRSDHAVQAIQKFMTDCADAATEIVYLAQNCVKDGVLQLVADAKMRYQTIITAMSAFFVSSADASGALSGSLSLGGTFSPVESDVSYSDYTDYRFNVNDHPNFVITTSKGAFECRYYAEKQSNGFYSYGYGVYVNGVYTGSFMSTGSGWTLSAFDFVSSCVYYINTDPAGVEHHYSWVMSNRPLGISNKNYTITLSGDNITYLQDAAVDGTSALNRMNEIPEPNKDPDDDKPVEIPMVPFPITKELEIAKTGQNKDADGNPLVDANGNPLVDADGNPLAQQKPGIIPSELIDELTKLVEQSKTDTPETPDNPDTDDDRTKRHDADWKNVFPFCVPFDLIEFLGVLAAEPVAPAFDWRFYAPNVVDYTMHIDLSSFDDVARICRTLELLAFCIGLILITRNIIRG